MQGISLNFPFKSNGFSVTKTTQAVVLYKCIVKALQKYLVVGYTR